MHGPVMRLEFSCVQHRSSTSVGFFKHSFSLAVAQIRNAASFLLLIANELGSLAGHRQSEAAASNAWGRRWWPFRTRKWKLQTRGTDQGNSDSRQLHPRAGEKCSRQLTSGGTRAPDLYLSGGPQSSAFPT